MVVFRNCILLFTLISATYLISCRTDNIDEVDCTISGPSLEVSSVTAAGCQPTGSITVSASGGNGELLYSIDGINFQESPTFSGLSSGSFSITVADATGCMAGIDVAIESDGTDLAFSAESTTGGCGTNEGTITVTASGGEGGYSYRLGTGDFESANVFENVSGGIYTISVKDAKGCVTSKKVTVQSGVSFASQIKPLMDANCSIVLCHGSDATIPKWTTYSDIEGSVQRIRSSVTGKTMPPDNPLSQNQIDLITCWIDDGAPNN